MMKTIQLGNQDKHVTTMQMILDEVDENDDIVEMVQFKDQIVEVKWNNVNQGNYDVNQIVH
jgi:hypothetical protein